MTAEEYNSRGNTYYDQGKYDLAIADYTRAIQLNPKYNVAYNNRGYAYNNQGKYDLAIADYTKAIQLDPERAYYYNIRGAIYEKQKEYEKALDDYDIAISLGSKKAKDNRDILLREHPELNMTAEEYNNRGYAYDDQGKYDLAIAYYTRAIEIDPKFAAAYNNRGAAYYNQARLLWYNQI